MQLPLSHFEAHINRNILARGQRYYEEGCVTELESIEPDSYEATVMGSEDYSVRITVTGDVVTNWSCDCPFDQGPVCKHVVATLYAIAEEVESPAQQEDAPKTDRSKKKPTRGVSASGQLKELIEQVPADALRQFVLTYAKRDAALRTALLSAFAPMNKQESKKGYKDQIKALIRSISGGDGYIDYQTSRKVGKAMEPLLEAAQKQLDSKHYESVILICSAMMEEMAEALNYADDSNGAIGTPLDFSYELLCELSRLELLEPIRKLLLGYCIEAFSEGYFEDWDWHVGMMEIAVEIMETEEEVQQINALLANGGSQGYEQEQLQLLLYQVLRARKGEPEADRFLEKHLANPELRKVALEKALNEQRFPDAIALAKKGMTLDQKSPGLVNEWRDWLVRIARAQNDKAGVTEHAKALFLDQSNRQDYYSLLKQTVAPSEWKPFVESLITELTAKRFRFDQLAKIFIDEQWWDRLLALLREETSLHALNHYGGYLLPDYRPELMALYEQELVVFMKNNTGRNHYETVVNILQQMKKAGGTAHVNRLLVFFREEYPQRRALMEELGRVD